MEVTDHLGFLLPQVRQDFKDLLRRRSKAYTKLNRGIYGARKPYLKDLGRSAERRLTHDLHLLQRCKSPDVQSGTCLPLKVEVFLCCYDHYTEGRENETTVREFLGWARSH